jgi:disulfide bond formation protein DsbB
MAYYHRDNPEQVTRVATVIQFTEIFVRLAGVLLLLVGLVVGIQVITEAWDLYRSPEHIERFSWAIEKGTNLDKSIAALTKNPIPSSKTNEPGERLDQAARSPDTQAFVDESIRLSYLLAWIIAILLLMLIGRLALAAIKTGGELALYDREVKGFARTLLKETSKLQRESGQQAVPFSTVKKK